jgi:hypothetical protein
MAAAALALSDRAIFSLSSLALSSCIVVLISSTTIELMPRRHRGFDVDQAPTIALV